MDGLIRQLMSINDSQFGFIPGRGTTDAIFVVRQLHEKYSTAFTMVISFALMHDRGKD